MEQLRVFAELTKMHLHKFYAGHLSGLVARKSELLVRSLERLVAVVGGYYTGDTKHHCD